VIFGQHENEDDHALFITFGCFSFVVAPTIVYEFAHNRPLGNLAFLCGENWLFPISVGATVGRERNKPAKSLPSSL